MFSGANSVLRELAGDPQIGRGRSNERGDRDRFAYMRDGGSRVFAFVRNPAKEDELPFAEALRQISIRLHYMEGTHTWNNAELQSLRDRVGDHVRRYDKRYCFLTQFFNCIRHGSVNFEAKHVYNEIERKMNASDPFDQFLIEKIPPFAERVNENEAWGGIADAINQRPALAREILEWFEREIAWSANNPEVIEKLLRCLDNLADVKAFTLGEAKALSDLYPGSAIEVRGKQVPRLIAHAIQGHFPMYFANNPQHQLSLEQEDILFSYMTTGRVLPFRMSTEQEVIGLQAAARDYNLVDIVNQCNRMLYDYRKAEHDKAQAAASKRSKEDQELNLKLATANADVLIDDLESALKYDFKPGDDRIEQYLFALDERAQKGTICHWDALRLCAFEKAFPHHKINFRPFTLQETSRDGGYYLVPYVLIMSCFNKIRLYMKGDRCSIKFKTETEAVAFGMMLDYIRNGTLKAHQIKREILMELIFSAVNYDIDDLAVQLTNILITNFSQQNFDIDIQLKYSFRILFPAKMVRNYFNETNTFLPGIFVRYSAIQEKVENRNEKQRSSWNVVVVKHDWNPQGTQEKLSFMYQLLNNRLAIDICEFLDLGEKYPGALDTLFSLMPNCTIFDHEKVKQYLDKHAMEISQKPHLQKIKAYFDAWFNQLPENVKSIHMK